MTGVTLFFGVLSFIPSFCDWYTLHVYKNVAAAYAHLTNPLPFLLGEILFYLAILFVTVVFVCSLLRLPLRRKVGFKRFHTGLSKSFLMTTCIVLLLYMLLWLLPFRTTPLTFGVSPEKKYTYEDLTELTIHVSEQINQITENIPRDSDGHIIVPDDAMESLKSGMQSLQDEFPLYNSFYPSAKFALASDFLEWSEIGGFTIPYTAEICLNRYEKPYKLYYYMLYAHEEAHHLGYFRENEGVFFGILSCLRSDCELVQLCGYYEAYHYLKKQAYLDCLEGYVSKEMYTDFKSKTSLIPLTQQDQDYFYALRTSLYEENVNTSMENMFKESTEKVAEVGWETQDKILKENNYDGVVLLLLRYFHRGRSF